MLGEPITLKSFRDRGFMVNDNLCHVGYLPSMLPLVLLFLAVCTLASFFFAGDYFLTIITDSGQSMGQVSSVYPSSSTVCRGGSGATGGQDVCREEERFQIYYSYLVDGHSYSRPAQRYIAILPGSRKGEISHTMPNAMKMADSLHALPQYAGYSFLVAGAPRRSEEDYAKYLGGRDYVQLVTGRTYDVLKFADAALVNSGTASLEAALIGTPQVVCWSTQFITAFLAKYALRVLDHIRFISLGNLILDRQAFRELIQYDYTPEAATAEIRRLVEDEDYRRKMLDDYAEIRRKLGGGGASREVAKAMIEELRTPRPQ